MRFVLVRHCQSAIDPSTPASTWGLTATGRDQAAALTASPWLRSAAMLVSGPEPKMTETLQPVSNALGVDLIVDEAFRETDASWLPTDEFVRTVERLFNEPETSPAVGWEPAGDAGARLLSGLRRLAVAPTGGPIVVCSGGRALTSLMTTIGAIDIDQRMRYWTSIAMPDLAVIDVSSPDEPSVVQHFGALG